MNRESQMAGKAFEAEATFFGDGEIGALIRSTDWSVTPLGPIASWPSSLVNYVKMLLELPSPAIIFWGPDQTQIYNQGYAAIMGPRHPRYFGAPYRECWPETYRLVYPWMQKLFEKGEVTRVEKTLIPLARHGFTEEAYFTFTFSPLRSDDGAVAGIFQPVVEVTEAVLSDRRAETLRQIEPKPDSRDPIADVIAAVSGDSLDIPFALLYIWNASANRLEAAARSSNLDGFEAEFANLAGMARRAFDSDAAVVIDDAGDLLGGKPIGPWPEPVHCAFAHPLRQPEGGPRGAVLFGISPRLRFDGRYRRFLELAVSQMTTAIDTMQAFQDARKRAEALAEIDSAKTDFFNNVSHEFRTPLTLILGPAEDLLARDEAALPAGSREQVDLIHRNGLRLLKLVNDLLDFSRFESGRMPTSFAATDLSAYTAEIVDIFRPAVERSGLELAVDCPPLPESVRVDRGMWEKIVLNLLSNALKFTHQGRISVALRSVDSHAELTVTDTGAGIPPEELPHLFTRFHRVRSARARTQEGSGIGLAMVLELIKLHGGTVRVESTVGRGTTFIVSIPVGAAHPSEATDGGESLQAHATLGSRPYVDEALGWLPDATGPPGIPPSAASDSVAAASVAGPAGSGTGPGFEPLSRPQGADRGSVFIVDDNADMRGHLRRILAPHWETSVFRDAASALSAVLENPPDLILGDVMMPDLDGFGLLQRLRADPRTADIPLILISARAGENATLEGIQAGAEDYLVKPFSNRELVIRVASRLEIARLRKQKDKEVREYIERLRHSETLKAELLAREQAAHADAEASRFRLDSLFMEAPALITILKGPDHVFEFANPAMRRLYVQGDLIGRSMRELIPEDAKEYALVEILDRVYRTGETSHGREFPVSSDWGKGYPEEKFFNFVYQPTRDPHGAIQGVAIFAFEVTSQVLARRETEAFAADIQRQHEQLKRTEAALRESEEHLRLSLDSARLGTWDFNPMAGFLAWSDRCREIFGMSPEATVDYNAFLAMVHPEDRERVDRRITGSNDPAGGGRYSDEYRIVLPDGRERWVSALGQSFFDDTGKAYRFIGTVLDVSDRKAAEKEIHKFLTLIEESRDIILILDFDGRIVFLNAAGKRLRGVGNSIIQPPGILLDLCFPEDQGSARRILADAMAQGSWEGEFRLRVSVPAGGPARSGGSSLAANPSPEAAMPVWWNIFVLKDHETGRPFALASVIRDLTQLKVAEEHLRQTQKMEAVGKLAGGIAHDFNNILTAINGYAELALGRLADPELRGYLQEIRKSGERAATLTRQLLAYSRKQMLLPKYISLNTIVADMEQMLRRFIGEDIELITRLDPALGVTRADPGQVEQIILNLVFNARDAMPNGGKLVLETGNVVLGENHTANLLEAKPGPYARLSVRDSGVGMTEAIQARIFEPFFTTKDVDKGTGLGLSSVYGIVQQSGGSISVQSAPGSGSVFSIYLPLAAANEILPSRPITPSFSDSPQGKQRILLVEDEDPVRDFVRKILEMQGFLVLESRNGVEALELARTGKEPIQLLLTDTVMPGMSGPKLAEAFRPLHPEAEVIFMSGYTGGLQATEEPGEGGTVFLGKPFSPTQLLAKIHDVLESVNA